ncbi:MAG: GntR family transcriptional regulator [Tepidisphaeraceae bacterium]
MASAKQLKAVKPQPGRPLYASVKEALMEAIEAGVFVPGEQMPSTKELSEQLDVSLVTAHRALQELVVAGVLERSQGRGTFVHHRYLQRKNVIAGSRVGLVFHREASLADFYQGQILEGIHRAANRLGIDLIILRFGEDVKNECNGYLLINPFPEEVEVFAMQLKRQPLLVVGAQSGDENLPAFDLDNQRLAKMAVEYLAGLGHKKVGFVGGAFKLSGTRERWAGFQEACRTLNLQSPDNARLRGAGWKLSEQEWAELLALLKSGDRPTAIFASGYTFALDVYAAVAAAGLRVPQDLSIVGVDDPPSAEHLIPPLTTLRQPLLQLGEEAAAALFDRMCEPSGARVTLTTRIFAPELVLRKSAAAVSA